IPRRTDQLQICQLIVNGVDAPYLGSKDRKGMTALHHACKSYEKDSYAIVCVLVNAMSPEDLIACSSESETALNYCFRRARDNDKKMLSLITHMRPEDLIRPGPKSQSYLAEIYYNREKEAAMALRERMNPHDFAEVSHELRLGLKHDPDDEWKALLEPPVTAKAAE
ncbi:MAG: hypothetical protein KDK78_07590, partial [Chlamydiia bacterium]|nr:hypothetical protein [Chlamydiia bacterium]